VQGKEDENEALGDALPHRERKRGRYQTRTDDDTHADARMMTTMMITTTTTTTTTTARVRVLTRSI
jgi:hypothetical protein